MKAGVSLAVKLRNGLRKYGLVKDPGAWIDAARRVLLRAYPRERDFPELQKLGIRRLVNVDTRAHSPDLLTRYGMTECHLPVPDFHAPTPEQLTTAVQTVKAAVAADEAVAIHCAAGLGRSGTVAACYLVELGSDWKAAIERIRALRPGAIETAEQVEAVAGYASRRKET